MKRNSKSKETFVVTILSSQNSTWQGTVTWVDQKKTQPFRSMLEMIKLIDSVVNEDAPVEDALSTFAEEPVAAVK